MQNQTSAVTTGNETLSKALSKPLQLATAVLLGVLFLYGAGFVQTSVAHNAAHDMRHAQGFPCH